MQFSHVNRKKGLGDPVTLRRRRSNRFHHAAWNASTAFRALAPAASFRGRLASLRFRPKNMAHHIFQLESELQNIPEASPEASPSFSVSETLARYGSSAGTPAARWFDVQVSAALAFDRALIKSRYHD
jgi:hypothetical protein